MAESTESVHCEEIHCEEKTCSAHSTAALMITKQRWASVPWREERSLSMKAQMLSVQMPDVTKHR